MVFLLIVEYIFSLQALGSIVLEREIGSIVLENLQNHGINDNTCHLTDGFAEVGKHGFAAE
jgi:hypothetical protein